MDGCRNSCRLLRGGHEDIECCAGPGAPASSPVERHNRSDPGHAAQPIDLTFRQDRSTRVLTVFERTTGYTVTLANERLGAILSKGVSGIFTADQALEKILANTGLAYHFTSATKVSVDLKSVATSIEVTANVDALAASSPKFAQDPLETPQTITAVAEAVMQQQGRHHAARCVAKCGRHQPRGRRRRRSGRQSDHPWIHRPQRSVHRRHARFRQLLSRSVQHAGG